MHWLTDTLFIPPGKSTMSSTNAALDRSMATPAAAIAQPRSRGEGVSLCLSNYSDYLAHPRVLENQAAGFANTCKMNNQSTVFHPKYCIRRVACSLTQSNACSNLQIFTSRIITPVWLPFPPSVREASRSAMHADARGPIGGKIGESGA